MFDDVHLSFGDLSQTRAAAGRVLNELLDPGTRIGIFTTSGRVTLDFSKDRDKIVAAMSMLWPGAAKHTDCPDVSYYMADQVVNKRDAVALDELTRQAIADCNVPKQSAPEVAGAAAGRSLQIHDFETRSHWILFGALRFGWPHCQAREAWSWCRLDSLSRLGNQTCRRCWTARRAVD